MTKKFVIIAGIITIAALAAAAVAYFLTKKTDLIDELDFEEDDEI